MLLLLLLLLQVCLLFCVCLSSLLSLNRQLPFCAELPASTGFEAPYEDWPDHLRRTIIYPSGELGMPSRTATREHM